MTQEKSEPPNQQDIRVIDRRAFTQEGDLRTPEVNPPVVAPSSGGAPTATPSGPPEAPEPLEPAAEPQGGAGAVENDPVASALFQGLVLTLARQATAQMGAAENPLTGQVEVDIDGAHQSIDLLNAIQMKTRGNLTIEERDMLEGLIGDLQMQYVSVRSRTPKTS